MKKLMILLLVTTLTITGCEKVSDGYKEGTYKGEAIDNYGGEENIATAEVTVDSNGKIVSVVLDTTYTKDGVKTTKKTLGSGYGMKIGNSDYGISNLEWDEQVKLLEQFVVDNNGIDKIKLDSDSKTDAVSGCTIKIDALYEALENALNQAKK